MEPWLLAPGASCSWETHPPEPSDSLGSECPEDRISTSRSYPCLCSSYSMPAMLACHAQAARSLAPGALQNRAP